MRHIKNYKELFETQTELSQEHIEWLNKCAKNRWTLNPKTGLVDVEEKFDCSGQKLTDFKGVRFGKVIGDFNCSDNRLTSLEGAPRKVGGLFTCSDNLLTSLEGAPQSVGGNFWCNSSLLTSLEGAPQKVGGSLYGKDNPVSEETLVDLYRKMGSGRSWSDAVASYWEKIKKEDKILLAQYNPKLSPEDVKGYQALAKFRNKII